MPNRRSPRLVPSFECVEPRLVPSGWYDVFDMIQVILQAQRAAHEAARIRAQQERALAMEELRASAERMKEASQRAFEAGIISGIAAIAGGAVSVGGGARGIMPGVRATGHRTHELPAVQDEARAELIKNYDREMLNGQAHDRLLKAESP